MPSLKDLKIRIDSVKSTRKITKAMQMVAAAKLRKAQESAERGRPYAEKMRDIVSNLASSVKDIAGDNKFLGDGVECRKFLLIVATAERGLCGGFNSSIVIPIGLGSLVLAFLIFRYPTFQNSKVENTQKSKSYSTPQKTPTQKNTNTQQI